MTPGSACPPAPVGQQETSHARCCVGLGGTRSAPGTLLLTTGTASIPT